MVLVKCPECKHEWNFTGNPKGMKHKIRCTKKGCRKRFPIPEEKWNEYKKEKLVKGILTTELCRHGITNNYFESMKQIVNSEVEILLRVSNPTEKKIGVSKIYVISKERKYIISTRIQNVEGITYKGISSFILEPEETKLIRLVQENNMVAPTDKNYIEAEIEIYNTKNEIIQIIPNIKLYVGFLNKG